MRSKEELDTYLNSLEEGDNITITADFLDALESASKDLGMLELLKKHLCVSDRVIAIKHITQDNFNKDKQELNRIRKWIKEG